ncbi:YtxH domain-containing protein [Cellulosimicrobium terreum]|nr:YtxH domain-containing protein [Cellulosimicrobium terreum]
MKSKIALVVGIGIGYVLGTRAGRERFDEIKGKAQDLWRSDEVRSAVGTAQEKVTAVAKEQGAKVVGVAKEQGAKVADVIKEQSVNALGKTSDAPDPAADPGARPTGADDVRI